MNSYVFVNQVTGPLFIDIINNFAEENKRVILLTGQIEKTYADVNKNIVIKFFSPYKRNNTFVRIYTWISFFLRCLTYIVINYKKQQRYFFVSNPPIVPFLGFICRGKFDILIYDIYPEVLKPFYDLSEFNPIFRMWGLLNKKLYKIAENIFTITDEMKISLSKYVYPSKITVVECWTNTELIKPIPKSENKFLIKYGLENKFNVIYSGNMGYSHDIESILQCAKSLVDYAGIQFILIGDGVKKKTVIEFVQTNRLDNVLILPLQDEKMFPFSIAAGDLAVVSSAMGGGENLIPSKTFYFLASGTPICAICKSNTELSKIIMENDVGYVISPGDSDGLKNYILNIYADNNMLLKLKSNSRFTSSKYSIENSKILYDTIIIE